MTLQEHYYAIKNGKGNKAQFLKQARQLFPQYINQYSDFDTATNVLKSKQIISEAAGGVVTKGFNIWDWKKILAEETKATEKNVSKEVTDALSHAYDNRDMKNADNINFNEIMKGFYCELRDEKNNGKTGDELKDIVVKNLAKDPLYYTKNGEFGTKGVGYTTEAPGLGEPKEPKGKYKSSGYGDLPNDIKEEKPKSNVQDSLSDSESKTSNPSKVKEMEVTPQNSPGVKKMPMPGKEKKIRLKEEIENKTYAVYELSQGQPTNFWNEEKDKFVWGDPKQATLYTKEEAEAKRKELLKPRIEKYQLTGKGYQEIHVGDLFEKRILKKSTNENLSDKEEIKWERQQINENTNNLDQYLSTIDSNGMNEDEARAFLEDQGLSSSQINIIMNYAFPIKADKDIPFQGMTEEQKLRSLIQQIIKEELSELSPSTYKSAADKAMDQGRIGKQNKFINQGLFKNFIGKELLGSTIKSFNANDKQFYLSLDNGDVVSYDKGGTLELKSGNSPTISLIRQSSSTKNIDRKDAVLLIKIIKIFNPEAEVYVNNFNIKGDRTL